MAIKLMIPRVAGLQMLIFRETPPSEFSRLLILLFDRVFECEGS